MKRNIIALAYVTAATAISAAGFFLIRNDTKSVPSEIIQSHVSDRRAPSPNEETGLQPASTAS